MNVKTAMMLLGLTSAENKETIKSKWRQKMKENHPDKYTEQGEDAVNQATERSKLINEAYEFVIHYIEHFGFSDFEECDIERKDEDSFSEVWIEDEVFDVTFTDSLASILFRFADPDSDLIRNIRGYKIGEEYSYFIKYSDCKVNPRVKVGDCINLVFAMDYSFVSTGYDQYDIISSRYIEENDRYESDYYDDSIVQYIRAGFVNCSRIVVESLDPFCIKLNCANNIENIGNVPNKIKRAVKSTYIQTLIAYKKIYKPETKQGEEYITFESVYAIDVEKFVCSATEIYRVLGETIQYNKTKRPVMFYHYSSRMKCYHGHTGVLHFEISTKKAEEIFSYTLLFDKIINSINFNEVLNSIKGEKVFVKKLDTVTAVTTIKSKIAKNGNVSYNFDTIFYDNDESLILNGENMLLNG